MKIYMRNENESDAVPFGECGITEVPEVIAAIKQAGGVYVDEFGGLSTDLSYQFCLNDGEGYAEIIVGNP